MKYLFISVLFVLSVNAFGNSNIVEHGSGKERFNVCIDECEDKLDKTNKTSINYINFIECVSVCVEIEK